MQRFIDHQFGLAPEASQADISGKSVDNLFISVKVTGQLRFRRQGKQAVRFEDFVPSNSHSIDL
ncbi:MAG: hypothetical protein PHQ23_04585, partial [Candidatus Wallbacteria bacterium]|nr:hypothetical protein [Candidatus Wallbacteria bacterium]